MKTYNKYWTTASIGIHPTGSIWISTIETNHNGKNAC